MNRIWAAAISALGVLSTPVWGTPQNGGPDRDHGISLLEDALRASLKDPESARFTWQSGFVWGSYKPLLRGRYTGWVICGTLNAKNGYGGYTGQYAAIGIIDGDSVVVADADEPGQWSPHAGDVADQCRKNGMPVL